MSKINSKTSTVSKTNTKTIKTPKKCYFNLHCHGEVSYANICAICFPYTFPGKEPQKVLARIGYGDNSVCYICNNYENNGLILGQVWMCKQHKDEFYI